MTKWRECAAKREINSWVAWKKVKVDESETLIERAVSTPFNCEETKSFSAAISVKWSTAPQDQLLKSITYVPRRHPNLATACLNKLRRHTTLTEVWVTCKWTHQAISSTTADQRLISDRHNNNKKINTNFIYRIFAL